MSEESFSQDDGNRHWNHCLGLSSKREKGRSGTVGEVDDDSCIFFGGRDLGTEQSFR